MKKTLILTLSLLLFSLIPSQNILAKNSKNEPIKPNYQVDWSIPATVHKRYESGASIPRKLFIRRKYGSYTYSGYIDLVVLNRYNTGKSIATYSGTIFLEQ